MPDIENRTYDEIAVGDHAEVIRIVDGADLLRAGSLAADARSAPGGTDAGTEMLRSLADNGAWSGPLIATLLADELPGPGTICLEQTLHFRKPVRPGEAITLRLTVREKQATGHVVVFECAAFNQAGELMLDGVVRAQAPTGRIRRARTVLPQTHWHEPGARYRQLVAATGKFEPLRMAIVHPCDAQSLGGAIEACDQRLIEPVLVGPAAKIRRMAASIGRELGAIEIVDTPHSHAAAARAVELARTGKVHALMKGALHTDELMAAVLDAACGLRTERRVSHVFVLDVPTYPKPLLLTDAAINISPTLMDKRDIVQNAIELAHAIGIHRPKVAVLSAVETVSPKITSTVEAAALCKMADRGQITGGIVDGPLAFDNAISAASASAKEITSAVAGDADILVVPDLESGNMLAKQLIWLAGAQAAGIVLGARVPIALTSRSDGLLPRLASCALAVLFDRHHRGRPG
jgi:phosphate acetyltransferase